MRPKLKIPSMRMATNNDRLVVDIKNFLSRFNLKFGIPTLIFIA